MNNQLVDKQPTPMKVISSSFLYLCFGIILSPPVKAQITTDGTTKTTLTTTNTGVIIEDGDIAEGNLFHSFGEFSVPRGSEAFFNNPNNIVNIFSRVTGGNISNIEGLIRANGGANLFLINPAGIIFGEGASLNIGGSFYASTADSILLPEVEFSATNLDRSPLLTVNAPIGLKFREQPGNIVIQSSPLQVSPGETLALIGGDVRVNGGIISVPGGNLQLGSVADEGVAELKATPQGLAVEYEAVSQFGDIQLNQQTSLNTSGLAGGSIQIQGAELSIQDGSQILSLTQGLDGGDIVINVDKLRISNQSNISTLTFGSGKAGDIKITATEGIEIVGTGFEQFQDIFIEGLLSGSTTAQSLQQGTGIAVSTLGSGEAGDLTINSSSLLIREGGVIISPTFNSGKGGNIKINTTESIELIGSGLQSGSLSDSNAPAGHIIIQAKNLEVRDGAIIVNATFGAGSGGDIMINVAENLELDNTLAEALVPTGILANSSLGQGQAGDVVITAGNLFTDRGAVINNNSGALLLNQPPPNEVVPIPGGNAGDIKINVSNLIELTGIGSNGITTSGISSTAFTGDSSAGNINITTDNLIVRDGARIDAATTGSGQGGTVAITARESILVRGTSPIRQPPAAINQIPSAIAATSGRIDLPINATGDAGNLEINTKNLVIQDGARIGVNGLGLGKAGELEVIAESITLKNQGAINAATETIEGGNIDLKVDKILSLEQNSLISAQAGNKGNGGNIKIDAEFVVAASNQNNDIVARAEAGRGGNIDITAEGVFGLQQRSSEPANQTNDIDASSDFGLDGTVSISTPDVGAFQEVIEAPEVVEPQTLGANACSRNSTTETSSFTVSGRGGVPPEGIEPLNSELILTEGTVMSLAEVIKPVSTAEGKIYPAQGVMVAENGDIILTAYATNSTQRIPSNSPKCLKSKLN